MLFCKADLQAQNRQNREQESFSITKLKLHQTPKTPLALTNLLNTRWKQAEQRVYFPKCDNIEVNAMQTYLLFTRALLSSFCWLTGVPQFSTCRRSELESFTALEMLSRWVRTQIIPVTRVRSGCRRLIWFTGAIIFSLKRSEGIYVILVYACIILHSAGN